METQLLMVESDVESQADIQSDRGASAESPPDQVGLIAQARDYGIVEKALAYMEAQFLDQPELDDVARSVGLSPFHFQRLFQRWVGVSPKRFLQFLTKEYAKEVLKESRSILEATFDSGLSSAGRLHDLMVTCEAATPGEIQSGGRGMTIQIGVHPTPFGQCLIGLTDRGVCRFEFIQESAGISIASLKSDWPQARLEEDPMRTLEIVDRLFSQKRNVIPLSVLLKGTNFQMKVWEALLRIPPGKVLSYEDVALLVEKPNAVRAVGGAIAKNRIGFIIPCHRVIRKMGVAHEYYFGRLRKKAILAWEAAAVGKG